MLKLSVAANTTNLTVQEDISISRSSCWNVKCHIQLSPLFVTLVSGHSELKAWWLQFWVSKVVLVFQSSHISSSACVRLESPSGADIPFLSSSGHSWFVGAALDVTHWGSSAVPQCKEDCEASDCSYLGCPGGDLGWGWGGLAPLETWSQGCHCSAGTTCLQAFVFPFFVF